MSGITRRSALRLFGSTAAVAGLGLAGCKKDEAQTTPANTEGGAADPEPESTVPTVDDIEVSCDNVEVNADTHQLHATLTITNNASVPCLISADVLEIRNGTDEYGDPEKHQGPLNPDIARGTNTPDSSTLVEAEGEAVIDLYASGTDPETDVDYQITEVEDATDSEYLLPDAYEISNTAVSTYEDSSHMQVTGTIKNKTEHRWSSVTVRFLALDANGEPLLDPWEDDGSISYSYVGATSTSEFIKPDAGGELAYKYDQDFHSPANIGDVASVEVLYVHADFDDEEDSDE